MTSYSLTDEVKVMEMLHFHPSTPGDLNLWKDSSRLKDISPVPPADKPCPFCSRVCPQPSTTLLWCQSPNPHSGGPVLVSSLQGWAQQQAANTEMNRRTRWLTEPQGKMWEVTDSAYSTQILDHCLISQHNPQRTSVMLGIKTVLGPGRAYVYQWVMAVLTGYFGCCASLKCMQLNTETLYHLYLMKDLKLNPPSLYVTCYDTWRVQHLLRNVINIFLKSLERKGLSTFVCIPAGIYKNSAQS